MAMRWHVSRSSYALTVKGSNLFVALLVVGLGWSTLPAAEYHVSPTGSDGNPGTTTEPFANLTKARDAARQVPAGQPKKVIVHDGKYFNVSLQLDGRDSGLTIEAAPGAKPVLIGGQPLTGWVKEGDHCYTAPLPSRVRPTAAGTLAPADWQVRLLCVDGQNRPRARFPAEGTLPHESRFDIPWMSTTGGGWKRPPTQEELTTLRYAPGTLNPDLVTTNAEITVFHMWDESCVGVASHDPENHLLKLTPAAGHPPGAFGVRKFVLWNTQEGLTRPGQWFHDRARNRIVYWPLPGEDMARVEVVAPTVFTILQAGGKPGQPLRDLHVRGLTFSTTTVPLITGGFAADAFPGAISLEHLEDCSFEHLSVRGVAGQGIKSHGQLRRVRVEGCEVAECGAGGIYVGGTETVIHNNHVHGVGRAYPSAVGIFRGGTRHQITHNEVHDCSYSAINSGGEDALIGQNLLYDCMKVLHDGAAIYVFGGQRTILRGNLARDITDRGGYPVCAYYLDERCTNCVVEGNTAVRVNWPAHNHMATNNIIRDNVFLAEGDMKITFPRSRDFRVERNLLYATGKIRVEGANAVTSWTNNLFFSKTGTLEWVTLSDYSAKDTNPHAPAGVKVADPLLTDWSQVEIGWNPASPARELGIPMPDYRHAGRIP